MAEALIAVQPPARIQTETLLYPYPVGTLTMRPYNPAVYYFAMLVLVGNDGKVVLEGINGLTSVTGQALKNESLDSATTFVFAFFDTSINAVGSFRVRLDIYEMGHGRKDGAKLVTQLETNSFGSTKSVISLYSPSQEESQFIEKMADSGISPSQEDLPAQDE